MFIASIELSSLWEDNSMIAFVDKVICQNGSYDLLFGFHTHGLGITLTLSDLQLHFITTAVLLSSM